MPTSSIYSLRSSNVLETLFNVSPIYLRQRSQLGKRPSHVFKLFFPYFPHRLSILCLNGHFWFFLKHYMNFCTLPSLSFSLPSIHHNFYFLSITFPASKTKCHCWVPCTLILLSPVLSFSSSVVTYVCLPLVRRSVSFCGNWPCVISFMPPQRTLDRNNTWVLF